MSDRFSSTSRRELLRALQVGLSTTPADRASGDLAAQPQAAFSGGSTVRLTTRAMACEFSVILNPGEPAQLAPASEVLNMVHDIEAWLSIYRENTELSQVNRQAAQQPVHVRRSLLELLQLSVQLHRQTLGAFDIGAGGLVQLWKRCRQQQSIPSVDEVQAALLQAGSQHLLLDDAAQTVGFAVPGLQLDPGAIGKGFALDEMAGWLARLEGAPGHYLLHGGHSSLLARGGHLHWPGWPIGIGNPLFTNRRLGTLLLCDQAMSTSGSNIQFYRHAGRRYGHILDPRTGWPVEGMLSVTVLADSAAVADAVSTAFFVLGIEKAVQCCENLPNVGAILVPFPEQGRRVRPTVIGIPAEQIVWDEDQVVLP